jgi:hypothetical protein
VVASVCAVSLTPADIGVVQVAAGVAEAVEEEVEGEEGTLAMPEIPKLREHTPSFRPELVYDPYKVHRRSRWKGRTVE